MRQKYENNMCFNCCFIECVNIFQDQRSARAQWHAWKMIMSFLSVSGFPLLHCQPRETSCICFQLDSSFWTLCWNVLKLLMRQLKLCVIFMNMDLMMVYPLTSESAITVHGWPGATSHIMELEQLLMQMVCILPHIAIIYEMPLVLMLPKQWNLSMWGWVILI